MKTTQKIKLDFNVQGTTPRIRAVQGDLYTRCVEISLYSHKAPWAIPEGTTVLIRYRKPDRTVGAYDTLPNGEPAWHLQGNTVTVAMAPDVLALPGEGSVIVSLIRGEQVLSAFEILLEIQPNHGTGAPSEGAGSCISGLLPGPKTAREGQILAVEAVNPNGTVQRLKAIDLPDSGENQRGVCYIATDHGVSPENEDNTHAMQELIDKVHAQGGGIIWMPMGEYRFNTDNCVGPTEYFRMCLIPKSGVSILGESITGTVIKVCGNTQYGVAWMANQDDGNIISGCVYQNFTVDMSEETVETFTSAGKAFGMKAIKNCVFRDLRLLNTPATSLGIDMLDNVVIDSIYIYRGGREWRYNYVGGAGIGIGTGKWENENYIIRNCVCVECGHYGIFLEDQGIFGEAPVRNYPKGPIITNNVIRNGRYFGIGIRGGKNVMVSGNNMYQNYGGIYLDYGAKNVLISGNIIAENTEAGLTFGIDDAGFGDYVCENIAVFGNSFFENTCGIQALRSPVNSQITNNLHFGNGADSLVELPVDETKIEKGVYINDAGEIGTNEPSWLYNEFIDMDTTIIIYTGGDEMTENYGYNCPRIAIYDENYNFLMRINQPCKANEIQTVIEDALREAGKSTNFRYIKIGDNCNGMVLTTMHLFRSE